MNLLPKTTLLDHLDDFLIQQPIPDELWVFAYGSLLWNPEINVVETRDGTLAGYSRGFHLLSTVHRGTPEAPGLVLALRQANAEDNCLGQVFRVEKNTKQQDFTKLWLREMVTMFYLPTWVCVDTPQGAVTAITFVADPNHEQYVDFDHNTCAKMISQAHGGKGPNADYFHNTYRHLQQLQIHDPLFEAISNHMKIAAK